MAKIIFPLLFVFLWSGAFIATRAGLPDISPITFLAARFTLAGLILLPFTFFSGALGGWANARRVLPHLIVAGILINGATLTAGSWAMVDVSAETVALLGSLQPLVPVFLTGVIHGDLFRAKQ